MPRRRPAFTERRRRQLAVRLAALEAIEPRAMITESLGVLSVGLGATAAVLAADLSAAGGQPAAPKADPGAGVPLRRATENPAQEGAAARPRGAGAASATAPTAGPAAAPHPAAASDWLALSPDPAPGAASPTLSAAPAAAQPSGGGAALPSAGASSSPILPLHLPPPSPTAAPPASPLVIGAGTSGTAPHLPTPAGAVRVSGGGGMPTASFDQHQSGYTVSEPPTATPTNPALYSVAIPVYLNNTTSGSITVSYTDSGGTASPGYNLATPGVDYQMSGQLIFNPTDKVQYITIQAEYDPSDDPTKPLQVDLHLTSGSGYTVYTPYEVRVNIGQNDGGGGPGVNTAQAALDGNLGGLDCSCTCDASPATIDQKIGKVTVNPPEYGRPDCGAPKLEQSNAAAEGAQVAVDYTPPAGTTSVSAGFTFNGATVTFPFSVAAGTAGKPLRFAFDVPPGSSSPALPSATGRYPYTVTFVPSGGATTATTVGGTASVFNPASSPYGTGWALNGVDLLTSSGGAGIALFRGDGSSEFFPTGSATAAGSYDALSTISGGYRVTATDQSYEEFSSSGQMIDAVDREGNRTTYTYDGSGRLTGVRDTYGRLATYAYDVSGHLATMSDFNGRLTTYTYSGSNLQSIIQPVPGTGIASPITTFTYSGTGLLQSIKDANNNITTISYTSGTNAVSSVATPGRSTAWQFAPEIAQGLGSTAGGVTAPLTSNATSTVVDPMGRRTTMTSDMFGNPLTLVDPLNRLTVYARNAVGLPLSETLPSVGGDTPTTLYTYDSRGDLLTLTRPDGTSASWTYDATFGQPLTATDFAGATTTFTLDARGNAQTATDPLGRVTSFGYDSHGNLASVTEPAPGAAYPGVGPRTTTYQYDSRGNLTTTTLPDAGAGVATISYGYNASNDRTSVTDANGHATLYGHDGLGRPTSTTEPAPASGGSLATTTYALRADGRVSTTTDAGGRITTYEYDAAGRLTTLTYPDPTTGGTGSGVTAYAYDDDDELTVVTTPRPLGKPGDPTFPVATTYTYDAAGRLTAAISPAPNFGAMQPTTIAYAYDDRDRLTTLTMPVNNLTATTAFAYDVLGRRLSEADPDPSTGAIGAGSPVTTWAYDPMGRTTGMTDPLGRQTTWAYDSGGELLSVTRPAPSGGTSPVISYTYDNLGRVLAESDPVTASLSRVTTYLYDARDRLTTVLAPPPATGGAAATTTYFYDQGGNVKGAVDPLGRATSYLYDARDRLTTVLGSDPATGGATGANSPVTTYQYDNLDRLTTVIAPGGTGGRATLFGYDAADRLVTLTDPDGYVTARTYDLAGDLATETDPNNNTVTYYYDQLGHVAQVVQPAVGGATATTSYATDAYGGVRTVTFPDGQSENYGYDELERPITVADGYQYLTGHPATTSYDPAGNVTAVTDPDGNVTAYGYDNLDRATTVTDPSGTTTYAYDLADELVDTTDPLGQRITYGYDGLGRRTAETWVNGSGAAIRTVTYRYDSGGQLLGASDPSATLTFTYDLRGRATAAGTSGAATGQPAVTLSYAYDVADRLTTRTDSLAGTGGAGQGVTKYAYDAADRLMTLAQVFGGTVSGATVTFGYDSGGRLTGISRTIGGTGISIGTSFTYDARDRVTSLTSQVVGGASLASYSYGYDPAGKLISEVNAEGPVTYAYDQEGQLENATPAIVANGGFESPAIAAGTHTSTGGSGGFQYAPTASGTAWTFTPQYTYSSGGGVVVGGAGIAGRNSPYTDYGPGTGYPGGVFNPPVGLQVGFVQGAAELGQTINVPAAGTYNVTFAASQAGTGAHQLEVWIDATPNYSNGTVTGGTLVTPGAITPSSNNYYATYSYPVALSAGPHTLIFQGLGDAGYVQIDNVALAKGAPAAANSSFEAPVVGPNLVFNPTGGSWTFTPYNSVTGGSGIGGAGSPSVPTPLAGSQVAFIQLATTISQAIPNWAPGAYQISLVIQALDASHFTETVDILVDGVVVDTIPSVTANLVFVTKAFAVGSGTHTLTFRGGANGNIAYLDAVGITPAQLVRDYSFDVPTLNSTNAPSGYLANPTNATWAFPTVAGGTGVSGILQNVSAYHNPPTPWGAQAAYIQGNGTITGTVAGMATGYYEIDFDAAQGANGTFTYHAQNLDLYVDGLYKASFTLPDNAASYGAYLPEQYLFVYPLAAGDHTLSFVGEGSSTGNTIFLDNVSVRPTSYSYDIAGNRTGAGSAVASPNKETAAPSATYTYDAAGELTAKTDLPTGNVTTYAYDYRHRLVGATQKAPGGSVLQQVTFTYDPLDRRIGTAVNGTQTWTVYDGSDPYADFGVSGGSAQLQARYVDGLLGATDASGNTSWYLADRMGSIRDVVSSSGTLQDHVAYDAFGNVTYETNSGGGTRYKFQGMAYDRAIALYYDDAREYDPYTGRFTSRDPIGFAGGDANLYRFVGNSPANGTDSTGLMGDGPDLNTPEGRAAYAVGMQRARSMHGTSAEWYRIQGAQPGRKVDNRPWIDRLEDPSNTYVKNADNYQLQQTLEAKLELERPGEDLEALYGPYVSAFVVNGSLIVGDRLTGGVLGAAITAGMMDEALENGDTDAALNLLMPRSVSNAMSCRPRSVRTNAPGNVPGMARPSPANPEVIDFIKRNRQAVDRAVGQRMKQLGVEDDVVGIRGMLGIDEGPFVRYPDTQGGGNIRPDHPLVTQGKVKPGINVDEAIFDSSFDALKNAKVTSPAAKQAFNCAWAKASAKDRLDAIIAHEYTELKAVKPANWNDAVNGPWNPHKHAILNGPDTTLQNLTPGAKRLLELQRDAYGYVN